ncbi:hypothetical protein EDEG_01061 [Edhazardia aedis USNM 41457]|uniref:Rad60/SUMO-like domain-containing protein n=1 Tax=Edhazardia aedis (strain USNM 41457) TaxID=1003232 RepID=J9DAJ1_EDHAE|nr:hypothetical protein EDEG_01061 [Edhazardia aedis USNM 41457]|eukprot:EJW04771.1 hypothetical protein EDEG_01061 [Edhazardia aedis USNM 41457]
MTSDDHNRNEDNQSPTEGNKNSSNGKRTVKLVLQDTEGNQIEYEIKRHIPLGKLLEVYCKSKNKSSKSLLMSIGGVFVDTSKNADELELDDGTEIEVVGRQTGGCF